ncbi:hypothetical protein EYR40_008407 [Pleurotus pulmonarius]|nr:hypothetical protein EYR40_008407 [Pleurotus pulmonarius]
MSVSVSPVEQVFSVRDLLAEILLHSQKGHIASYARVCKFWSDEALSTIWRAVNLHHLLLLLAPFNSQGTSFSRPISAADWSRFDKYAWRVYTLTCSRPSNFEPGIFDEIALKRLRRDLLPNLTTLEIDHSLSPHILPLFSHASVQRLRFCDEAANSLLLGNPEKSAAILSYFPVVMPGLRTLSLTLSMKQAPGVSASSVGQLLASVLCDLHSLEEIILTSCLLTESVILSLLFLPRLRAIQTADFLSPYGPSICPLPPDNCFPQLETLHIADSQAAVWLSQSQFPPNLLNLEIHTMANFERSFSPEEQYKMMQRVARQCQRLRTFSLTFSALSNSSLKTLQPITFLAKLETLRLVCLDTLEMEQDDLVTLLQALPHLRILKIFMGLPTSKSALHLSVLSSLSPVAPRLEILGLPFDIPLSIIPMDVSPFPKLRSLNLIMVGNEVPQVIEIAKFLSCVLPDQCTTEFEAWHQSSEWNKVGELLSAIRGARTQAAEPLTVPSFDMSHGTPRRVGSL